MFSTKPDYAADFKEAYESNNNMRMLSIMSKWGEDDHDDSNFFLAFVIVLYVNNDKLDDMFKMYQMSLVNGADNEELHEWYDKTALELIQKKGSHNIKNDSEGSAHEPQIPSRSHEGADDGFAKHFVDSCRQFEMASDFAVQDRINQEMRSIVDEWGRHYPEDANYSCAYGITHIFDLSDKALEDLLFKAKTQTPIDEKCYMYLLGNFTKLVAIKTGKF